MFTEITGLCLQMAQCERGFYSGALPIPLSLQSLENCKWLKQIPFASGSLSRVLSTARAIISKVDPAHFLTLTISRFVTAGKGKPGIVAFVCV